MPTVNCLTNFGLKQLFNTAAACTDTMPSALDHIVTNRQEQIYQSRIIQTGSSDHNIIFCTCKIVKGKIKVHDTTMI